MLLSTTAETVLAHTFARAMNRAGEALGVMSGHELAISAPDVRFCHAQEVVELAGGPDTVVVAVYLGITGSLSGHAILLLPPEGAHRLAGVLLDGFVDRPEAGAATGDPLAFGELELSALQEVGNVTLGAFLNEIGRHLQEPVQPTVPQAIIEMAGAILDSILLDLVADTDEVLAARTTFHEGNNEIEGALLVLPRLESLAVLVEALGAGER
jgi:chemotaxis protein CheC